ncbi:MAG: amidohydrolase family protein [Candidatus Binatia bacterium]
MIIDAHAHCDVRFGWVHTPEVIIRMMDEGGIDKACVTGLADIPGDDPDAYPRFVSALHAHPDRLVAGYLRINPWYGEQARDLLRRGVAEDGIKGLKLHPTTIILPPHAPAVVEFVRMAGELGIPVLIHSGDEPNAMPLQIGKCAEACPDTDIIMGHMGGVFFWEDALRVAERYPNVYLDPSGNPIPDIIRRGVDAVGAERVVFGTDMPAMHPRVERKKLQLAGLTVEQMESICWRNIARLMRLPI